MYIDIFISPPGYAPAQPGYAPPQPGYAPPQPGYAPPQPEYAPPQPGYAPYGYTGYQPPPPQYAPGPISQQQVLICQLAKCVNKSNISLAKHQCCGGRNTAIISAVHHCDTFNRGSLHDPLHHNDFLMSDLWRVAISVVHHPSNCLGFSSKCSI